MRTVTAESGDAATLALGAVDGASRPPTIISGAGTTTATLAPAGPQVACGAPPDPRPAGPPVVFLSGGASTAEFVAGLELVAEAGVPFAGALCGRAIWQDGIPVYGAEGAEFLARVKQLLEEPVSLAL